MFESGSESYSGKKIPSLLGVWVRLPSGPNKENVWKAIK